MSLPRSVCDPYVSACPPSEFTESRTIQELPAGLFGSVGVFDSALKRNHSATIRESVYSCLSLFLCCPNTIFSLFTVLDPWCSQKQGKRANAIHTGRVKYTSVYLSCTLGPCSTLFAKSGLQFLTNRQTNQQPRPKNDLLVGGTTNKANRSEKYFTLFLHQLQLKLKAL